MLDSLFEHLMANADSSKIRVRRSSRKGKPNELGPLEIISVVVGGLTLLAKVIELIQHWLETRKRQARDKLVVRIRSGHLELEIRLR
jgi:hypothetical protein